eukprot:TRINITY_DN5748_c0_g1_i1.p1 TRINITY_DN5748_c0_g1~~TRINITY_DN5748_c0_g1_i1.p1  ORF type:complete len:177 (+),score=42.72 TRINITY_DN5748_c0_g1_i1:74-604(+)
MTTTQLQATPVEKDTDAAKQVTKRLRKELMSLMSMRMQGVSAFPIGDDLFGWMGTVRGTKGTPYEDLDFKLNLRFTTKYPFEPPQVKFVTNCFHPNVDQFGNICLDILKDQWSSAYGISQILLSIQALLAEPNNDSPLNNYAASIWANKDEYVRVLRLKHSDSKTQFEATETGASS